MTRTRNDDYDSKYGLWPRRLLHVPSLTSYEWMPGNCYGGKARPAYNTLSYTWGRFALKEHEMPDVGALPIRIEGHRTWKIPRINPEHFTVDEFKAAVKFAVQAFSGLDNFENDVKDMANADKMTVEFLWLDVACIDQGHAKTKIAEINRQAVIFRNARTSCVWMNHLTHDQLRKVQRFSRELQFPTNIQGASISHAFQIWVDRWFGRLQEICQLLLPAKMDSGKGARISAPWFSSLWTLQEAYLRPNACVLPGNCLEIAQTTSSREMPALRELFRALGNSGWIMEQCLALDIGPRDEMEVILDTVREGGLRELLGSSPFAVFSASNRRQTSNPRDRVYGIMQIFGVQLPIQRRGKLYELVELQNMLSEKILLEYPVESQLFVHTEPQAPMSKWKIGTSVVLPGWASALTKHLAGRGIRDRPHPARPRPLCKFSVTHGSAYFQGRLCSLADLVEPLRTLDDANVFKDESPDLYKFPEGHVSHTTLNVDVAFDMVPNTLPRASRLQIPGIPGFLFGSVGCSPEDTHQILAKVASTDTNRDLKVLLLGSCLDPLSIGSWGIMGRESVQTTDWRDELDEWLVGLILRKTGSQCSPEGSGRPTKDDPFVSSYERIGVCKWFKVDHWYKEEGDEDVYVGIERLTDDEKVLLSGKGDCWYEAEGYWG
ncbi:hypothetical protein PG993_003116 [Apiospora rasikravindrae]|uniref:Heterokaryon incompatibility domain-containing protein n=1 Tax=Apiospora rasikravindrae TaxID=990691 RepID=A0ABR1TYL5_9PEZI